MKDLIQKLIVMLRKRVDANLNDIKESERIIRLILEEPDSDIKDQKLKARFKFNKKLLDENNDSINLQLALIKYFTKYKNEFLEELELEKEINENISSTKENIDHDSFDLSEMTEEEIFELTVNEELEYDEEHPLFESDTFYKKLMEHYMKNEDYERCQRLVNSKKTSLQ